MAPKTKPVASSSSAAAPEIQMSGSSRQEAPISGKEPFDLIFLQVDGPEMEYKNLGFEKIVKIVSPTWFEIEAWTHTRVLYSLPGQMVVHFEVELSKTLENIVKLVN